MLPHHQPLIVAEQFLMLEALYPGRIDLGVGRTLGFTEPVRHALRQQSDDIEKFKDDVTELRSYLEREAAVTARPVTETAPELFLLATGQGITTAAQLGLPVVIGGPVLHSPELPEMLRAYRRSFQATAAVPHPSVIVSLEIFIADTQAEARELALPEAWAMARSRETGRFEALEPAEAIRSRAWSPRAHSRVEKSLGRVIAGPPGAVRPALEQLMELTGAGELLASTSTYDRQAQAVLDQALAALVLHH